MNPSQHPIEHPEFDSQSHEKVWYLSHPLAADEKFSFEENMADVLRVMRLCFDEGFRVIAPYHTICLCLDDDNAEHRRIGLETDCTVAYQLGRIIMSGHKTSRGMSCEFDAVHRRIGDYISEFPSSLELREILEANVVIDITEMSDDEARETLREFKARG